MLTRRTDQLEPGMIARMWDDDHWRAIQEIVPTSPGTFRVDYLEIRRDTAIVWRVIPYLEHECFRAEAEWLRPLWGDWTIPPHGDSVRASEEEQENRVYVTSREASS